jgi:hypothetical protein
MDLHGHKKVYRDAIVNPTADITATERVSFVMKEGRVIRNGPAAPSGSATSATDDFACQPTSSRGRKRYRLATKLLAP